MVVELEVELLVGGVMVQLHQLQVLQLQEQVVVVVEHTEVYQ
jgi:hypothetical protein